MFEASTLMETQPTGVFGGLLQRGPKNFIIDTDSDKERPTIAEETLARVPRCEVGA